jgi:hypothetical protein
VKTYLHKYLSDEAEKWKPESRDEYTVMKGTPSHRTFVVVKDVLTPRDIALLHKTPSHPSAIDCNDRHKKLDFKHSVHRIERVLKAVSQNAPCGSYLEPGTLSVQEDGTGHGEELYRKLLRAMCWADEELWGKLKKRRKVYPEVEYIAYDTRKVSGGDSMAIRGSVLL